jgi:hypothetical protein
MTRLFLLCLLLSLLFLLATAIHASAQVVMSTTGTTTAPPSNAVLLLEGNGTQGLIIPVGDRNNVPSPAKGMIIYDTNANQIYYNDGAWKPLGGGGSSSISISGNTITVGSTSVNLALGFSNSANGFLYWNGTAWQQAQFTLPTTTQALVYNPATSSWGFQSISGGGGGISTINKGGAGSFISITNPAGPITTINADAIVDGDISGSANISGTKLQDGTLPVTKLSAGTAINGQFLRFNAGSWTPATIAIPASVTNVTATAPLISSGGTTPNISLSGTLPVANGGTGRTTWDGVLWGNGTGSITDIGNGTNGQVFTMQGTTPGWSPAASSFTTTNVLPKGSAGGLVASSIFEDAAGNMGIGASSPANKLHIGLPASQSGLRLSNPSNLSKGFELLLSDFTPNNNAYVWNWENAKMYFGTSNNFRMTIDAAGNVGIGTTTPGTPLEVIGAVNFGDTSPQGRLNVGGDGGIQGMLVLNRTLTDGTLVRFRRDGGTEGDISVSGSTVSYNAFTGSHYGWMAMPTEKGMLVTLTGNNKWMEDKSGSELMYGVIKSSIANDPKIMGTFLGLQSSTAEHNTSNPYLIMAVGNGEAWVVDNGQDIEAGDYLISSTVEGHAMKDIGEFDIAHVVAKVAEPLKWKEVTETINGVKHKRISIFFEAFDRNHKAEKLEKEIGKMKNEINNIQIELEKLKSIIGAEAKKSN